MQIQRLIDQKKKTRKRSKLQRRGNRMPEIVLIYINEINFENARFLLISQFSLKTLNVWYV